MTVPIARRIQVVIDYQCRLVPPEDHCWMLAWLREQGLTLDRVRTRQNPVCNLGVGVAYGQFHHKDLGWQLHLWFARMQDALMFKLRWGGKAI